MGKVLALLGGFLITLLLFFVIFVGGVLYTFNNAKNDSDLAPLYNTVRSLSFFEFMARISANPKFIEKYFLFDAIRNPSKHPIVNLVGPTKVGMLPTYHVDVMTVFGEVTSVDSKNNLVSVNVDNTEYLLSYESYSLEYKLPRVKPGEPLPNINVVQPIKSSIDGLIVGQLGQFSVYKKGNNKMILYVFSYINL